MVWHMDSGWKKVEMLNQVSQKILKDFMRFHKNSKDTRFSYTPGFYPLSDYAANIYQLLFNSRTHFTHA